MQLLIDEYVDIPTSTSYMTRDVDSIPAPAFTICLHQATQNTPYYWFNSTNKPLTFEDVVLEAPVYNRTDAVKVSTINGERIITVSNGKHFLCFSLIRKYGEIKAVGKTHRR